MIQRHHYVPSETQRAELKCAAIILRQRIKQRRAEREAFEAIMKGARK
jgi:hypothetical protein